MLYIGLCLGLQHPRASKFSVVTRALVLSQLVECYSMYLKYNASIIFVDPAPGSWIKVIGMLLTPTYLPTHPELSQAGSLKKIHLFNYFHILS